MEDPRKKRLKALVVDDDRLVRRMLREGLEAGGIAVLEAGDGRTALAMVRSTPLDLIFLDVVMPEMDGFHLCALLRQLPASRNVPILMVTALDDERTINQAYTMGATHYITKPINKAQLLHQVRFILRANGLLDDLRQKEGRLAEAQRVARLGSWEWIPARAEFHCSEECRRILGIAPGEGDPNPDLLLSRVHPEDRQRAAAVFTGSPHDAADHYAEYRVIRPDGSLRHVQGCCRVVADKAKMEIRVTGTVQDVSERKAIEEKLLLAGKVFDHSGEMIFITDAEERIVDVNPAFARITGFSRLEAIGETAPFLPAEGQAAGSRQQFREALARAGQWQGEIFCRRKTGEIFPALVSINSVRNDQGETTHYVSTGTDISGLREAESRLDYLTNFDPLTGLPNRRLFLERLRQALDRREPGLRPAAVLTMDLDHFKEVNETFGHHFGDQMLKLVRQRLENAAPGSCTCARLESDLFALLYPELPGEQIDRLPQQILEAFARPFALEGREIFLTASVGIALAGQDGESAELLVKHAETALHVAKEQGQNTYLFFSESMNARSRERLALKARLRRGLERDEFFLHFQPKFDSRSGRLTGLEALARWRSSDHGLISPAKFIPLAEETGLILPLGERLLRLACAQNRAWLDRGLAPGRIAVNLSAHQFYDSNLVLDVAGVLKETGLDPRGLELEITEGAMIQDMEKAVSILKRLRSMGIRIALDDFGTGYSSLTYLKSFPLDAIKIDHSFVKNIFANAEDAAIVKAIIGMAHSLKLSVIAEGVETEEQRTFLREQGCDEVQGYLAAMPLPVEEVERLLPRQVGGGLAGELLCRAPARAGLAARDGSLDRLSSALA